MKIAYKGNVEAAVTSSDSDSGVRFPTDTVTSSPGSKTRCRTEFEGKNKDFFITIVVDYEMCVFHLKSTTSEKFNRYGLSKYSISAYFNGGVFIERAS